LKGRREHSERAAPSHVSLVGPHLHCCLDNYYIARVTPHADHCAIDGPGIAPCHVPNEEHAREVVCMWVRLRGERERDQ